MKYDPSKFENKWWEKWEKSGIYSPKDSGKNKYYALVEFPYPSGDGLHVGHVRSYTAMDVVARKRRMEGYNVLYPIGWDAFGLPTENYAIKTGTSPQEATKKNTDTFRRQLKSMGFSFDWTREIDTTNPDYYKWTQWMFLKFFENGMAYKAKVPINWCPKDKIGLANEEVVDGRCERCGTLVEKRDKEQWMIRITKYADKLLEGLKEVDYIPQAVIQQTNWIGKSEGAEIEFKIEDAEGLKKNLPKSIKVFTTRPDTLFGATYMVVAPEYPIAALGASGAQKMTREVEVYISEARKKAEEERTAEGKDKTGVELKGIVAINPATKEKIPVWVADYVLPHYGTGAIMAVPAHDERDFEFAKKFDLPIRQVIRPAFGLENKKEGAVHRDTVTGIVLSRDKKKILLLKWKEYDWLTGVIGGREKGESAESAAEREVLEETGYRARAIYASPILVESHFYADHKKEWRSRLDTPVLLELVDDVPKAIDAGEAAKHEVRWVEISEALSMNMFRNNKLATKLALSKTAYSGFDQIEKDFLVDSGKFSGMDATDGAKAITKEFGTLKVQYKLRDWVFSRQRYWGEPIPIIHCPKCGQVPVPEKDLPVKLPKVEKYQPTDTGESPLANISSWVNVKCSKCKGEAKRETDVMPNWAGSSWYFIAYCISENLKNQEPISKQFSSSNVQRKLKYWMGKGSVRRGAPQDDAGGVDWYNGGMEHTVLHLLYSRFWNRFFFDLGFVPVAEPFKKRTSQGLILAEGGVKMSKSKGNVVNPDGLVKEFGADALRLYELFMGPFNQAVAWDTRGIVGTSRFLERVWTIGTTKVENDASERREKTDHVPRGVHRGLARELHKLIKKVGEDVEAMAFNTAVSAMMMFVNEVTQQIPPASGVLPLAKGEWELFLKILAPFAPFTAEELWSHLPAGRQGLGHKKSIHSESWPKYDPALIVESTFELVIQVNGKVRGKVQATIDISQEEAEKLALAQEEVKKWVTTTPKKVIFVKNRLINFII